MKEMNDKLFDTLIRESFDRRHILDEINAQVMRDIKASARRQRLRHWARLLTFCFGMPAILMAVAGGTYYAVSQMQHWQDVLPLLASALFGLAAIGWQFNKRLSEYSWK